jgi:hypothetical protein
MSLEEIVANRVEGVLSGTVAFGASTRSSQAAIATVAALAASVMSLSEARRKASWVQRCGSGRRLLGRCDIGGGSSVREQRTDVRGRVCGVDYSASWALHDAVIATRLIGAQPWWIYPRSADASERALRQPPGWRCRVVLRASVSFPAGLHADGTGLRSPSPKQLDAVKPCPVDLRRNGQGFPLEVRQAHHHVRAGRRWCHDLDGSAPVLPPF